MSDSFVHLHNHSDYSLLDGAQTIEKMVAASVGLGMPALALTDHGNMFGAVDFYDKAKKAGLNPIVGMEAYVTRGSRTDRTAKHGPNNPLDHLVLLAKDQEGYRNLVRLSSVGFVEGFYYKPRIDHEILARHSKGLIALSACLNAELPKLLLAGRDEEALSAAGRYSDIFGKDHFYIELQDHGIPEERLVMPRLVELSKKSGIPLVATNDCHYSLKEDADSQDVLVCIQTGKTVDDPNRMKMSTDELYFKTPQEMRQLFRHYPEACDRTLDIAAMCGLKMELGVAQMPHFPCPEGFAGLDDFLAHVAREGCRRLYPHQPDAVRERLEYELGVIRQMGYAGYFLVVQDFIDYARQRGIPVGPGRGSAAGSLVAYCTGITAIDPIRFELLFERFLNPERISMPDIDVDFEDERRDEIIQYVRRKYGEENVSQIITFGTMAARAAIRDVGRALGMTYGEVDRVAKLVPEELGITLDRAIETVPELKEMSGDPGRNGRLIKTAQKLEGLSRHASTHAAGVIIAPRRLDEIVPLFKPANKDEISTQYDMNAVEKIGLVKMDFLGLRTLKVIDRAVKLIRETTGETIDPLALEFDDPLTMELLRAAKTVGVFQVESDGMRNLLRRLGPTTFEDIVAVNALYRPGPMGSGMVDDFIECKAGRKEIHYEHPSLESILKPTYGMMVYQEQVMQIASRLAGYSLGQADLLRRAMGKKKPEEMAKQKEIFVAGATERGVAKPTAEKVFDLMAYFAGYGFNKSHSAAYALITYQTAWLKAHHPIPFMAAALTSEMEKTDRIVTLIEECRKMGIPVLPPDVNASDIEFGVEQTEAGGAIRYGLGAVKNVGEGAIRALLDARCTAEPGGLPDPAGPQKPFKSLYDFCRRVDLRPVNKRVVESLVAAGAFDALPAHRERAHRAQLHAAVPAAMEAGVGHQAERERGQFNLFGGGSPDTEAPVLTDLEPDLPAAPEWDRQERLRHEKAVLGFYLSDHPLAALREEIAAVGSMGTAGLAERGGGQPVTLVGVISGVRKRPTSSGRLMAYLTLEDFAGSVECVVFPDLHDSVTQVSFDAESGAPGENLLQEERIVLVRGRTDARDEGSAAKIVAEEIVDFERARASTQHVLHVTVPAGKTDQGSLLRLRDILSRYPGKGEVILLVETEAGERVRIRAGGAGVAISGDLLAELRGLVGGDRVRLAESPRKPPEPPRRGGPGQRWRRDGGGGAGAPRGGVLSGAPQRGFRPGGFRPGHLLPEGARPEGIRPGHTRKGTA